MKKCAQNVQKNNKKKRKRNPNGEEEEEEEGEEYCAVLLNFFDEFLPVPVFEHSIVKGFFCFFLFSFLLFIWCFISLFFLLTS